MLILQVLSNNNSPKSSSPTHPDSIINEAHEFGRNIALPLAMACMQAAKRIQKMKAGRSEKSDNAKCDDSGPAVSSTSGSYSKPTLSAAELRTRMIKLSAEVDANRAELVALLALFDEQKGWEASGSRNCADWADAKLGIAKSRVYKYLRVGRALKELPTINMLFRGGELSWSKTRALTRVADVDSEDHLAHVALDASVSDVERICKEFRWSKHDNETIDPETGKTVADLRAEQQFNHRSVTWQDQSDGSIQFRLKLPPDQAQIILKSLEHCVNELYESTESKNVDDTPTITQRRADVMLLMAERSLQHAGTAVSRADRYQVVVHVGTTDLIDSAPFMQPAPCADSIPTDRFYFPAKAAWIEGVGPIADSVVNRIACDASLVTILSQDGEPLNVGRQTRIWTTAIRRAIVARDRHCQFPGCTQHHHLQIHHIDHWANGGETSVENGICLCHHHHALVHEGGYIIERNSVETDTQPGSKDIGTTIGLVSPAQKALLPTRHRFRFIKPAPEVLASETTASGCCDGRADENIGAIFSTSRIEQTKKPEPRVSQCNEAQATYWSSAPLSEIFSTSRIREIQPVYH